MYGPTAESFRYVLKSERESLKEEQTIFHIKILTASDSAKNIRAYSRAFSTVGNKNEVNESQYIRAYRGEWNNCVLKVENYKFGYKFPELQEKGYQTFDDPDLIAKMFEEMPENVVKEVIEAAKGEVTPEEIDRKK